MAVQNTLQKNVPAQADRGIVEYECGGQPVKLSPAMVKNYLVNGNGAVTDQEVMMFISLCKFQKLNPFMKEAYLIKYGNQPATIVVGKEAFMKRAMRNPNYAGYEAGVVIVNDETGVMEERVGTIVLDGESLVGGWARVHIKGWVTPLKVTVNFGEYCLMKDGKPASNWAIKPSTMIRKVALVQALREAFPEDVGGLYTAEEHGEAEMPIDITPDMVEEAAPEESPAPEKPAQPEKSDDSVKAALMGK